jgi:hypothetical protein
MDSSGHVDLTPFCASICTHNQSCASIDLQSCENNCKTNSTMFSFMRCDFLSGIEACYPTTDCASVKDGTAEQNCITHDVETVSPSAEDTSFCSALASAMQGCGTSFSQSDCTNLTKVYGDGPLSQAQACTTQACTALGACVSAALPGYRPGSDGELCSGGSGASLCIDKSSFAAGEPISVRFAGGPGQPKDWIAVYPSGCCAPTCPSGSTLWEYCATDTHTATGSGVTNGTVIIDAAGNPQNWPLPSGTWDLLYLVDDGYSPIAKLTFQVGSGGNAPGSCGNSSSGGGCTYDSDCSSHCSNDCYQCLSGSCTCGTENSYGVCTF